MSTFYSRITDLEHRLYKTDYDRFIRKMLFKTDQENVVILSIYERLNGDLCVIADVNLS